MQDTGQYSDEQFADLLAASESFDEHVGKLLAKCPAHTRRGLIASARCSAAFEHGLSQRKGSAGRRGVRFVEQHYSSNAFVCAQRSSCRRTRIASVIPYRQADGAAVEPQSPPSIHRELRGRGCRQCSSQPKASATPGEACGVYATISSRGRCSFIEKIPAISRQAARACGRLLPAEGGVKTP